ncbi:hypothetical protein DICVIV_11754 [Dictyocaulus viviparus]|uniref:Uncharacterized protein n=1 Tax=Dictyocaulus viviparus TaxID=29172 RepID=A0A0D8XCE4_DICVI|nr:hypothetical protein DICVIV_11754 [Dictyocaulus viviparus]
MLQECNDFQDTVCTGDLQWTVFEKLLEILIILLSRLKAECCTHHAMSQSKFINTVLLGEYDKFEGGVVRTSDHTASFDLIKEVRKLTTDANRVQYIVTVHRVPCHPVLPNNKYLSSRRKREMHELKKKEDSHDFIFDGTRKREVFDDVKRPLVQRHSLAKRRRSLKDVHDKDYNKYDYDVYVPRAISNAIRFGKQPIKKRPDSSVRVHADGGLYQPKKAAEIKVPPNSPNVINGLLPSQSVAYENNREPQQYNPYYWISNQYPSNSPTSYDGQPQYFYYTPANTFHTPYYYYNYPSSAYNYVGVNFFNVTVFFESETYLIF